MVKDIKVPTGNPELEQAMGKLLRGVKKHKFVPGNKISAELQPREVNAEGVLVADLAGGKLNSDLDVRITQSFPLHLEGYEGPMDIESIFSRVEGARIDDGGNVQNQVVDMALVVAFSNIQQLLDDVHKRLVLTVASSGDPFDKLPLHLKNRVKGVVDVHTLDLPGRVAVQVPWVDGAEHGTLGITSEARESKAAVEKLIQECDEFRKAFHVATCFATTDSLFEQLEKFAEPDYCYIINASTAFRTRVAEQSYKRAVLLPMNEGEAADVCRVLLLRATDEEQERPPFPSPFKPNGYEVDTEALRQLDVSLDVFRTYLPFDRQIKRGSFAAPISFGPKGGLIVGVGHEDLACFTTIPNPDGETRILKDYCEPSDVVMGREFEMGAGDAVASMVTLFQAIDPQLYIKPFMEEGEGNNRQFINLVSTIFLSVLSRIVGNLAVRNRQTNLSNVRPDAFTSIFEDVAQESITLARTQSNMMGEKHVSGTIPRWGISALSWRVGQIAYPPSRLS
ncbi:MAG: hypothetical protein WCV62_05155 [Candidatus Peribacteraceae bacterium]|jgi:hypothetical protein